MNKYAIIALLGVAMLTVLPAELQAGSVTWSFSQDDRQAEATYKTSGNDLVVTLTNTSTRDVTKRNEVLTAVFFDMASRPDLTAISAIIPSNSDIFYYDGFPNGGDVGGEWAFVSGSSIPGNARYGISSTGLDVFGPHDRFNPDYDLDFPASPGGLNFGITSAVDNESTFMGIKNGVILSKNGTYKVPPLIKNEVTFTLRGVGSGFNPANAISKVWFQYGTNLREPNYSGTPESSAPEPITMIGAIMGVAAAGQYLRKRRLGTK